MFKFLIRRLLLIPPTLALVNVLGFAYALLALRVYLEHNPFRGPTSPPPDVPTAYLAYLQTALAGTFGKMPGGSSETVASTLQHTLGASAGLLALASVLSLVCGFCLGLLAVQNDPPRVRRWLLPFSTSGLAMPSFFIGGVCMAGMLYFAIAQGPQTKPLLPLYGFGWDAHIYLPLLALSLRPTAYIAQLTANLLTTELSRQYVTAARSLGYTWRRARWRAALKNIFAPLALAVGGTFRLLAAELLLVETLFGWPGLGRLFASTLIAPQSTAATPPIFLYAPLLASALTLLAAFFLLADLLAAWSARAVDPRLAAHETIHRDTHEARA